MSHLTDLLIQAGLVNEVQVQVAMHDLQMNPNMRLSEVLALRGWIHEETVDFFELLWEMRLKQAERSKIGQYLLEARLMTQAQIEDVLAEQRHSPLRFGEIAVLKGYVKPETIHFFVKHLYPHHYVTPKASPFARATQSTLTSKNTQTYQTTFVQKEEEPVTPKRSAPKTLWDRLNAPVPTPVLTKGGFLPRANQKTTPASNKRSTDVAPAKQKPTYRDHEAFSTHFDLSAADDFDMNEHL